MVLPSLELHHVARILVLQCVGPEVGMYARDGAFHVGGSGGNLCRYCCSSLMKALSGTCLPSTGGGRKSPDNLTLVP